MLTLSIRMLSDAASLCVFSRAGMFVERLLALVVDVVNVDVIKKQRWRVRYR